MRWDASRVRWEAQQFFCRDRILLHNPAFYLTSLPSITTDAPKPCSLSSFIEVIEKEYIYTSKYSTRREEIHRLGRVS